MHVWRGLGQLMVLVVEGRVFGHWDGVVRVALGLGVLVNEDRFGVVLADEGLKFGDAAIGAILNSSFSIPH